MPSTAPPRPPSPTSPTPGARSSRPAGSASRRIEPGLTHSELAGNVTHAGQADELAGMFDQIPALSAERRRRPARPTPSRCPPTPACRGSRSFPPVRPEGPRPGRMPASPPPADRHSRRSRRGRVRQGRGSSDRSARCPTGGRAPTSALQAPRAQRRAQGGRRSDVREAGQRRLAEALVFVRSRQEQRRVNEARLPDAPHAGFERARSSRRAPRAPRPRHPASPSSRDEQSLACA